MKRIDWNHEAQEGLRVSAGDDLEFIKSEVERGISELYQCGNDGFVVTRYESEFNELVLVLGEGEHFHKWIPVIEEFAKRKGAKTIRTHIKREGLKRWYESRGWSQSEIVMSMAL